MRPSPAKLFSTFALAALAGLPLGCGGGGEKDESAPPPALSGGSPEFAGRLQGSDALIAVSNDGGSIRAFVCGTGSQGPADYFGGEPSGELKAPSGATLDAEVSDAAVSGTVTLPGGQPLAFAAKASPGSGLYEVVEGANTTDGISAGDTNLALKNKGGKLQGTATPPGKPPTTISGTLEAKAPIGTYVAVVDTADGRICGAGTSEQIKQGVDPTLRLSASLDK
jgi:hypothetical protein